MSNESPYPGLRPFERYETDIFFGREEHTDQLLERFEHTHFLAVVGPSGCGKSSLVRTGLLAGLETGLLLSTGSSWCIAELRPGNQPFARLTDALIAEAALGAAYTAHVTSYLTEPTEVASFVAAGAHRAMLQAQLRRGPFSLHEILANALLPEHSRLLIVVDQFEEIFRYYQQGQEDEAAAFVSLLLASSQHPNVYVVLTMRSDFIGDCALFHGLPEAINQGLFLTPRLNREQLRAAIEEPAGVFGGKIAPALVNRLLNDTGNNPDQLPVLQHALMRMWTMASAEHSAMGEVDGGQGMTLTMDHYARIGGLDTALSQHADEAYNELDLAQQHIAAMLFRSLSERGSDRRDTRRPVALSEAATLAQVPWPQVAAAVEVFRREGRSFLTPPAGKALEPDSVLDISHESLIRQWQRLQAWTTEEAEAAELYQRLEDSAGRWEKGYAALLRTPELEYALQWRASVQPTAAWARRYGQHFDLAMRFLDASAAQQQAEQ
jgi:energy-coupling factor transporter ATP-binding protein EcfA2